MSLLAPWRPATTILEEMDQFRRQMGRVLGGVVDNVPLRPGLAMTYPAVNVREDDDFVYVESELPGIKLEDLEISIADQDQMLLKGTHTPIQPEHADWYCRERPSGCFERTIDLPASVDAGKVDARLEDGVLCVKMNKTPEAKPIKIIVKAE